MSFQILGDLNWLAVAVAAIAYFALGGIWYAPPVFGRAWIRSSGVEMPEGGRPGPGFYVVPFAVSLLATIATAMLARATGAETLADGLVLGLVLGVGFAVPLTALGAVFERKPDSGTWFGVTAGYHLVGLLIVAVIVSAWR